MATNFSFGPETTLQEYFAAMQGGMPEPSAYQPPTATFEQLMGSLGSWNPSSTAPSFPTADYGIGPIAGEGEGADPVGYGQQDGQGPFSQVPMPWMTDGEGNPSQWSFWGQDDDDLAPLQNWANFMQPWLSQLQANYQYEQDSQWSRYADQSAIDLNIRQQQAYEQQQALTGQQWLSEFERTSENDVFSQEMALQNLVLNQARLAQEQEAARYNAFGRSSAPGRFSASWG